MANRLTKIYTRGGDQGTTGLGTNDRVAKFSPRVHAMGDVDETNSWIGHIRSALGEQHPLDAVLNQVQHDLFDVGGELAMPGYTLVSPELVRDLEAHIDRLNADLPTLENFILPAGNEAASRTHVARSVARRAERQLWAAQAEDPSLNLLAIQYLNRLSDFLFVLSRVIARENGGQEVLWQSRHQRSV
ncbi:cob(I)yrinic acid a,c-diamide adenosyltransferase [Salinispirillum marinum]|uniref:Corrinoid adenosyltransferase n=2 Tax=Saccharospirillaceae TaxID=255527 RepID=A0ABV8BFQ2_9GAMM